ncbi:MAG: universal stress protein [Propionicimonas sp.]|nr:universal stress protein [Propionicimonas sp.]
MSPVPQPGPERLEAPAGRPLVVGVVPGQPALVALTAAAWAAAVGGRLDLAYADPERVVDQELADGSVRHSPLDPDLADDRWVQRQRGLEDFLGQALDPTGVEWRFHYLAGRADRALTHLARAVGAAGIVVGGRHPSRAERLHEFFAESVALHLVRHQHRPVLVVPLSVVDWKAPLPWR